MIRLYLKIPVNFVRLPFRDGFCVVHTPFVRLVEFQFLAQLVGITFPTQSCPVLYSFCANLLYMFIMGLIFSCLSPHNLHLLFSCVLFIFALIVIWRCFVLLSEEIQFLS